MPRVPTLLAPFVLTFALAPAPAAAQSGPGVPNLIYDQSELFTPIASLGTGSHGHSFLHDGYVALVRYGPGAVDFYDFSNPYAPQLVTSVTQGMSLLSEPHTMAQTDAYGGLHVVLLNGQVGLGGKGFSISDWTDIQSASVVGAYDIPGVPGGYATGVFWFAYQAPYVFCGAGSLGLYVIDASDPASPIVASHLPTSQTGGFNVVDTVAVGNTLIVTNADGGPGMARFDISDPTDPQLVHATTSTSTPYGIGFNGGHLLVPAVSGPVGAGGNGGVFERRAIDAGFGTVATFTLPSRGGSAVAQDDFVHVAASTAYVKLDLGDGIDPVLVGSATQPNAGGDWDWVSPFGNLSLLADDQAAGTSVIPHAAHPDNTGPRVTFVDPRPLSTNAALTSRVGVTMSDMIDMTSIDASTFVVRPLGGASIAGHFSNQFGVVNFSPLVDLLPNTTYEVVIPAGGMRDWAGNPASEFRSVFSTGGQVSSIDVVAEAAVPVVLGAPARFDVVSVSGQGPFQFSWDFGDGTPATPLSGSSQATHTYAAPGHHAVVVTVTDGVITGTASFLQTVYTAPTRTSPTHSSTLTLDASGSRLWCVNADNDSVTAIDTVGLTKVLEAPVGAHPRTVAEAHDGTIWVACQSADRVDVLDANWGNRLAEIALPTGSRPYGIAMNPHARVAYVTLEGTGEVALLDTVTRQWVTSAALNVPLRGVAVSADGKRVFVSRFISSAEPRTVDSHAGEPVAQVYELAASHFGVARELWLRRDPGPDTDASGRGLPNYLSSLTISPDGRRLWVPSKKDNIDRGSFRDGQDLTFENTVRTISSQIDLRVRAEDTSARIDFNNRDLACAIAFSPLGDYAFHALQGSNAVDVRDVTTGALVAGIEGTGLAPQGLTVSPDGERLFVHNFMSRSVSIYSASGVTSSTDFELPLVDVVGTVANEALSAQVLAGKRIFYNAADPRMSEDGYLSCATCHLDGGHDGMTWDFTDRGEGLRNTTTLLGRSGTGHGNVHWTANFDEIQDFENDMRGPFGGAGFMDSALFSSGTVSDPLGQPKAGLSPELDALAAYVSSLGTVGVSPERLPGGALSPAALQGRALFQQLACAQCHAGTEFTNSPTGLVHNVGTIGPGSGQAIGAPLFGFDTPTLRGLWASAPYLHNGSARTLRDVLTTFNPLGLHGATSSLSSQEVAALVTYLRSIDDLE